MNQDEKKKPESGAGRRDLSYTLWTMAGLYLLYLTWSLSKTGEQLTLPVVLFMALFAVTGTALLVLGCRGLWRAEKRKKEAQRKADTMLYTENAEKNEEEK